MSTAAELRSEAADPVWNPYRDSVWGQGAGSQVQGAQGLPPQWHTYLCKHQCQVSQVHSLLLSVLCRNPISSQVLRFYGLYILSSI